MERAHAEEEREKNMLTNVEIIYNEGVPDDTMMMTVPKTDMWLECKKWLNGRWRVTLMDPLTTYRKVIWQSLSNEEMESIYAEMAPRCKVFKQTERKELVAFIRSFRTAQ